MGDGSQTERKRGGGGGMYVVINIGEVRLSPSFPLCAWINAAAVPAVIGLELRL